MRFVLLLLFLFANLHASSESQSPNQGPIFKKNLPLNLQPFALTDEQITSYETLGFVIIPQLLSKEVTASLDVASLQIIDEVNDYLKTHNITSLDKGKRIKYRDASVLINAHEEKPCIHVISWVGGCHPAFLDCGRSLKLLVPLAQLLGSYKMDHLINQLHPKAKGDKIAFTPHQDVSNRQGFDPNWRDVNGRGSFVQLLIAIDENTKENGALQVIPLNGDTNHYHLNDKPLEEKHRLVQELLEQRNMKEPISVDLKPGDAVFFHPLIVHYSEPNNETAFRRCFINSCSYPGANTKAYPGNGSAATIELKEGKVIPASL